MLLIDKIIWGVLAFFFLTGWLRGFLKSLIGPIAFLCCFISAVIFYDLNRNILMAAVITFAGTVALSFALSLLLGLAMAAINKEYRGKVFLLSRILGATVNVLWQGNILFIIFILFSIFPTEEVRLVELQKQIPDSTMISYYKTKVVNKDVHFQTLIAVLEGLRDPNELKQLAESDKFKRFQEDPKFQDFIHDPEVLSAIEDKDTVKLLKLPSLRTLVTNDSSMLSFTKLTESIYMHKLDQITGTADPELPR